jgi:hypothetical protein
MNLKDHLEGSVAVIEFAGEVIPGDEITSFHRKVHLYLDRHIISALLPSETFGCLSHWGGRVVSASPMFSSQWRIRS